MSDETKRLQERIETPETQRFIYREAVRKAYQTAYDLLHQSSIQHIGECLMGDLADAHNLRDEP